jgi:heavy metal sensor kinase
MKRERFSFRNSLRAQLALWQAGILALTLLIISSLTLVVLRTVLQNREDTDLTRYATTTARGIEDILHQYQVAHHGADLSTDPAKQQTYLTFINNGDPLSIGRYVQVIDPTNHVVAYSDALRTNQLPPGYDALKQGLAGLTTIRTENTFGSHPVRIVTTPVRIDGHIPFLVQVGASVEGVEEALARATQILLIVAPFVFFIGLVGGWNLVGRALKPVDEMTRAALTIESKRLDTRLTPVETDNEIGRLASALNTMIARLDRSFKQIERFSADASHELKTPLTSIRGEAEVALMSRQTPEERERTLRSIIEETERLTNIVNNLLVLARADANQIQIQREPTALHEVAMAAFESVEMIARKKGVSLDISEMESVTVLGDSLWLQQLAANLLQNAVKYTPEGGTAALSLTQIDGCAQLSVTDTGPGIASDHLPHLFDRFYRVDSGRSRDQGGTGLGLNISQWIVQTHNGRIEVRSELGKGSCFTVYLPAEPDVDYSSAADGQ